MVWELSGCDPPVSPPPPPPPPLILKELCYTNFFFNSMAALMS